VAFDSDRTRNVVPQGQTRFTMTMPLMRLNQG
jgi:hypothetical protein